MPIILNIVLFSVDFDPLGLCRGVVNQNCSYTPNNYFREREREIGGGGGSSIKRNTDAYNFLNGKQVLIKIILENGKTFKFSLYTERKFNTQNTNGGKFAQCYRVKKK